MKVCVRELCLREGLKMCVRICMCDGLCVRESERVWGRMSVRVAWL